MITFYVPFLAWSDFGIPSNGQNAFAVPAKSSQGNVNSAILNINVSWSVFGKWILSLAVNLKMEREV
jgi:hypothetical protein